MGEIRFEDIQKTISSAAESVGKKTELFIEMQKVRTQIHTAKRSAEQGYRQLGELVYRRYRQGEVVDEELAQICDNLTQTLGVVRDLKEELAAKKGKKLCPVCQAEIELEAEYCMKCGSKIAEKDTLMQEDEMAKAEEVTETRTPEEEILEAMTQEEYEE